MECAFEPEPTPMGCAGDAFLLFYAPVAASVQVRGCALLSRDSLPPSGDTSLPVPALAFEMAEHLAPHGGDVELCRA